LEVLVLDLVGRRYLYFLLSIIVIVPGAIALLLGWLRPSIDFTGGTLWELQFERAVEPGQVRDALTPIGYGDSLVQTAEGNVALIRLKEIKEGSEEKARLSDALRSSLGSFTELRLETVGPTVGEEVRNRAFGAVALASIAILGYIAWNFRKVKNPIAYGTCAIIAMLHDVLVTVGVFALLGQFAGVEVDALFVTALLTVIGFSVHDTIVVFDRIRENQIRRVPGTYEEIVNYSLLQTVARSVSTSLVVIFTLLALYLFGGTTTRTFVLALLVGVVSGAYSSIFNASQLLIVWETGEWRRWLSWLRPRQAQPA
jgi:preprotein translocase subunit SecF